MNDLLSNTNLPLGCTIRAYADDVFLIASANDLQALELALNAAVENIQEAEKLYEHLAERLINVIKNYLEIEVSKNYLELIRRLGKRADDKSRPIVATFATLDPPCPTQEFELTPIIISSREEKCKGVQNILLGSCRSPNLPNIDIDSYTSPEIIPKNLCYHCNDMSLSDSLKEEEPLGSSTASKEAIEKNISSNSLTPTVLLETNFDFMENDKVKDLQLSALNPELRHAPVFKILDCDPRSPSVGLDRTPIVVHKKDELSTEDKAEQVPIKHLQNDNSDVKTTNGDSKSSDGILIYEDDSNYLNVTPKSQNLQADLDQTDQMYSYWHLALVSLKNAAIKGDCENTSPNSHRHNWDKEGSIVLK
ncbi:unnamed protein product [Leptosia nina]|uniref:Reverse transcriptase domain-containing protein n=1 Tax=Leptosia nina TaxID=320188 RepID=A0AAV1JWS0_9NEOP